MANLPYGEGNVAQPYATVLPDARDINNTQKVDVNSDMFGGAVAKAQENIAGQESFAARTVGDSDKLLAEGISRLGQGATEAGKFMGQVAADDATNRYMEAETKLLYGDPDKKNPDGSPDQGYFGYKGADAAGKRAETLQQIEALRQQERDKLATPDQKLRFDQATREQQARAYRAIGAHAEEQSNAWADATAEATIQGGLAGLARDPDDQLAAKQVYLGFQNKAAIRGGNVNDPNDVTMQAAHALAQQKTNAQRMQTWVERDPHHAMEMLQKYPGQFGEHELSFYKEAKSWDDEQVSIAEMQRQMARINGVGSVNAPETLGATDPSLPRGLRNNNPGNIKTSSKSWEGQSGDDGTFVKFSSPEAGIAAMVNNLRSYQSNHGLTTVADMIGRWAPPSENNTSAYAETVAKAMGIKATDSVNLNDPAQAKAMVSAMIRVENGRQPYSDAQITNGLAKAGIGAPVQPQSTSATAAEAPVPRWTESDAMHDIWANPNLTADQKLKSQALVENEVRKQETAGAKQDMAYVGGIDRGLKDLDAAMKAGAVVTEKNLPDISGLDALAARNPLYAAKVDELKAAYDAVKYGSQALNKLRDATRDQMADIYRRDVESMPATTPAEVKQKDKVASIYQEQQRHILEVRANDASGYEMQLDQKLAQTFSDEYRKSASGRTPGPTQGLKDSINQLLSNERVHGATHLTESVLPKEMATDLTNKIMAGQISMSSLRATFGDDLYNSHIITDLERRGGLSPQMVNAQYFGAKTADGIRQMLLDKDTDAAAKAMFGDMNKSDNPIRVAFDAIEARAAGNGDIARLTQYMSNSGSSVEQTKAIVESIKNAAKYNALSGNSSSAADDAVKTFLSNWSEIPVNSSGGAQPWVAAADAPRMQQNISRIRQFLQSRPNYLKNPDEVGVGPGGDLFPQAAATVGQWVGEKDTGGLKLVGPGGQLALDAATGKPIVVYPNTIVGAFNAKALPAALPISGGP